ncbi:MAG: OmpH family outer membrane protein [Pseudomonadota bacterium]
MKLSPSGSLSAHGSRLLARCFSTALVAIVAAGASLVSAQEIDEGADSAVAQDQNRSAIVVVDQRRVLRESLAAASIAEQTADLRRQLREEIDRKEVELRDLDADLATQRDRLEPEVYLQRARELETRVRSWARERQDASARLQEATRVARDALRKKLTPILVEIMQSRQAKVLLPSDTVVLSLTELDITDEAIERLNDAHPDQEVVLREDAIPLPGQPE